MSVYNWGREKRKKNGLKGREWAFRNLSARVMCDRMIGGIETAINNFEKRKRFDLYKII
jgi:hypothetical protein